MCIRDRPRTAPELSKDRELAHGSARGPRPFQRGQFTYGHAVDGGQMLGVRADAGGRREVSPDVPGISAAAEIGQLQYRSGGAAA